MFYFPLENPFCCVYNRLYNIICSFSCFFCFYYYLFIRSVLCSFMQFRIMEESVRMISILTEHVSGHTYHQERKVKK